MKIVVDANESRSGLPDLLKRHWDGVEVRRLQAGDVALGDRVLVERKTFKDFLASLADKRLFRQVERMVDAVPRSVIILEGAPEDISSRVDPGAFRGALLALAVGYGIPVLTTRNLEETADMIRHMAAQESRREARRRRVEAEKPGKAGKTRKRSRVNLPPEAIEVLLSLPGVGPTRARAIAGRIASLGEIYGMGVKDFLAVPGIGPDTAARIVDLLRAGLPPVEIARQPTEQRVQRE